MADENRFSVDSENDAVCFSAGLTGVAFGAGVIHAYLASDRKPPKVVAGISLGALTAAAMERCYHAMDSRSEADRWKWFRRYLSFLLDRPYDVLWDAIPSPSDFQADLPPVQDPGLPPGAEGEAYPREEYEAKARRSLHLLARAGQWFARIPVKFSAIAWLVVRYVRLREHYPKPAFLRIANAIALAVNLTCIEWRLMLHAVFCPQFFPEWQFTIGSRKVAGDSKFPFRPLLGWPVWRLLAGYTAGVVSVLILDLILLAQEFQSHGQHPGHFALGFAVLFLLLAMPLLATWMVINVDSVNKFTKKTLLFKSAEALGLSKSLFDNFRLLLRLFQLFAENGRIPKLGECDGSGDCKLILVSAPLQVLPSFGDARQNNSGGPDLTPVQLWPTGQVGLVDALQAALALPGVFEPFVVAKSDQDDWLLKEVAGNVDRLDMVDGSTVRQNPLPALFSFLHGKSKENKDIARQLSDSTGRVFLVYDVPILPGSHPPELPEDWREKERTLPNIIDTAFSGQRLARRRDSRLEVLRTNHITRIQQSLAEAAGRTVLPGALTITVTDIAPEEELHLDNELKPGETEILKHVAAGCRQTLGVLYRIELAARPAPTDCRAFLQDLAQERQWSETSPGLGGASEVCRHCTRKLAPAREPVDDLLPASFQSAKREELVRTFPGLAGPDQRIVFLASGGVFRGSFHIGMLGAFLAANIKPDMIVGASVGTLMGAVLGAMFSSEDYAAARDKLNSLAALFIEVDKKIALTRDFKAAIKDLGRRGRGESLHISPNDLRKMVLAGSRRDPGLAVTGAPPALIDAISDFLLIPYKETGHIAAEFVAGHIPEALKLFWTQIKTETIERLGIQDAVIGATLLEREIPRLLGSTPDENQPFLKNGIAFFATTVDLITEWPTILGAEMGLGSYNLVEALLSSCAFPAAFAPRRASAMYPGVGRRDVFFGDGGMFDNLPFIPAIQILRDVQQARLVSTLGQGQWRQDLLRRHHHPDLFLVGALDVKQGRDPTAQYDALGQIWDRAASLADNEKIYGFERSAHKIDSLIAKAEFLPSAERIPVEAEKYLNGIVNTAILPVYPTDKDRLNGTFHFCESLGMSRDRIRLSIGDGCYRTLHGIASNQTGSRSLPGRSLAGLTAAGRVPRISIKPTPAGGKDSTNGTCPFFAMTAAPEAGLGKPVPEPGAEARSFTCPFHGATGIFESCSSDKHQPRGGQDEPVAGRQETPVRTRAASAGH